MTCPLFNSIVDEVANHSSFFRDNIDCTEKGISSLLKFTSAIRQLAYGIIANFLDEYLQMSERISRLSLDHFCSSIIEIFGPKCLRKLTVTDVVKLYRHHEEKHGFPGMLGCLDSVASQDLWIWHAFFGVVGSNNDINGYYLVDGIYLELATLVKTIPEPADDDNKRILYKLKQESAKKDVERAFNVLKKKWAILANPARALKKERIMSMMYTCIILHNIIRKFKGVLISPKWFLEEAHQPDDLERSDEQVPQVMRHIRSAQAHKNLRADLVEHLSRNV
ncbi:ALP1-like protein [Tanacetum coccineum]